LTLSEVCSRSERLY